jgi:hypothetical protein
MPVPLRCMNRKVVVCSLFYFILLGWRTQNQPIVPVIRKIPMYLTPLWYPLSLARNFLLLTLQWCLKVDFTLDIDENLRIFELGHPFSNFSGLENYTLNLFKKLKSLYGHVYVSGDYLPVTQVRDFIHKRGESPPEYVPLADLFDIKTDGIVVVRMFETPSHYTPFCIQQQLRERGSRLQVFQAEPVECLMAYEKILMQRLQIQTGISSSVPSALINLSSTQDFCREVQRQFVSQGARYEEGHFLIKPAFSSCGIGTQYAKSKKELKRILTALQTRQTTNVKYQRSADTLFEMVSVLKQTSATIQERHESVRQFLVGNNLQPFAETRMPPTEDPFWIVQQVVFSPLEPLQNRQYMPTFRTFLLLEEDESSVKVSFLEKVTVLFPKKPFDRQSLTTESILAGVSTSIFRSELPEDFAQTLLGMFNDQKHKTFFNSIFRQNPNDVPNLIQSFPELSEYYEAILSYPPYQKMLMNVENEETKRYEDLVSIYSIQRHFTEDDHVRPFPLHTAISLIELYDRISMRKKCYPCQIFFPWILCLYERNLNQLPASARANPHVPPEKLRFAFFSGALRLSVHSIRSYYSEDGVHRVYTALQGFVSSLFAEFPEISPLCQVGSWQSSEYLLFFQLIRQKRLREAIIEYTCQLCSVEKILKERGREIHKDYFEQRKIFLDWSLDYFCLCLFPMPSPPEVSSNL